MMNRRKAITLACAAAAGLSRPTWGLATGKPSADDVLRLGQSTALTGANGAVGRQFRDAALGWFNVVNSQGGAGGYRIELMFDYESAGWEIRDSFAQSADTTKLASSVGASVSRGSVDVDPAVAALVSIYEPHGLAQFQRDSTAIAKPILPRSNPLMRKL